MTYDADRHDDDGHLTQCVLEEAQIPAAKSEVKLTGQHSHLVVVVLL